MKLTNVSYSLSNDPATLSEWKEKLYAEISGFVETGSDVILYPELFLAGLGKYFGDDLKAIADFTEKDLLPEIAKLITQNVFLVLGTGPRIHGNELRNSAFIYHAGKWHHQDKLFLTPWETAFTPGSEVKLFSFHNLIFCVAICFDSEQPDLAVFLKKEQPDVILVPSATTNRNGSDRVNRCSSARSVELGALVVTSPLVGDSVVDLVDHNEGRQGFFYPSQDDVAHEKEIFSEYSSGKHVITHHQIDVKLLLKLKLHTSETKPYHKPLHPGLMLKK